MLSRSKRSSDLDLLKLTSRRLSPVAPPSCRSGRHYRDVPEDAEVRCGPRWCGRRCANRANAIVAHEADFSPRSPRRSRRAPGFAQDAQGCPLDSFAAPASRSHNIDDVAAACLIPLRRVSPHARRSPLSAPASAYSRLCLLIRQALCSLFPGVLDPRCTVSFATQCPLLPTSLTGLGTTSAREFSAFYVRQLCAGATRWAGRTKDALGQTKALGELHALSGMLSVACAVCLATATEPCCAALGRGQHDRRWEETTSDSVLARIICYRRRQREGDGKREWWQGLSSTRPL